MSETRLTDNEKKILLEFARTSIVRAVRKKPLPTTDGFEGSLNEPGAAFVTVHVNKELRGCYGFINAVYPLPEAIQDVGVKAALDDPRFDPVRPEELKDMDVEISVLTPPEKISSIEEIQIGVHGLIIESKINRGLLLPHVATEYGWDREQFLDHTALKAGLPPKAWKEKNVILYKFTTDTFSESQFANMKGAN